MPSFIDPAHPGWPATGEVYVYSMVLLAAMTAGGETAGFEKFGPGWGHGGGMVRPLGGAVIFFWMGPIEISPAEEHAWQEYIDALEVVDRDEAMDLWCKADCHGRKLLLGQVAVMRAQKGSIPEKKDDKPRPNPDDLSAAPAAKPRQPQAEPATLIVTLPATAQLQIGGQRTTATGSVRSFRTPALAPGRTYQYTLEAALNQEGRSVQMHRRVELRSGSEVRVTLAPSN